MLVGVAGKYHEGGDFFIEFAGWPANHSAFVYSWMGLQHRLDFRWINIDATKIGYEISFNKYFYRHKALRSIEEVSTDILKLEEESDGLIREILNLS